MRLVRFFLRRSLFTFLLLLIIGVVFRGIQQGLHALSCLARLIGLRTRRRQPEVIIEISYQRGVVSPLNMDIRQQ